MICRQRRESPAGLKEQMVIFSHEAGDSRYTLTVLLAGGQVWRYTGGPEGDRWVFNLVSNRPDPPQRLRQIITPAADSIHFREEVSVNGGEWQLSDPSEDYRYVRRRAGLR